MATCRCSQPMPRRTAPVALDGALAGHAVADAVDAAKLLDVDVDQLARLRALVADHRRAGTKGGHAAAAAVAQHLANNSDGAAEPACDNQAGRALAPQRFDRILIGRLQACWAPTRTIERSGQACRRRHVGHATGGQSWHSRRLRLRWWPPTCLLPGLDDQHSTMRQGSCMLIDVHPRLRVVGPWPSDHSL